MRTLAEAVIGLRPGDSLDLAGEHLQGGASTGGRLNDAAGWTLLNAQIHGEVLLVRSRGVTLAGVTVTAETPDTITKGLLTDLGGRDLTTYGVTLDGGRVAGQLSIGLADGVDMATGWTHTRLTAYGNRQWSDNGQIDPTQYPRAHCVYINGKPTVDCRGRLIDCTFDQRHVGAVVKLGGTGKNWRFEGCSGVAMQGGQIVGAPGPDGRAVTVLAEGVQSRNLSLSGVTQRVAGGRESAGCSPQIQVMNGARVTIDRSPLLYPDGVEQRVQYFRLAWGWLSMWMVDTGDTPGPRTVGGLFWR